MQIQTGTFLITSLSTFWNTSIINKYPIYFVMFVSHNIFAYLNRETFLTHTTTTRNLANQPSDFLFPTFYTPFSHNTPHKSGSQHHTTNTHALHLTTPHTPHPSTPHTSPRTSTIPPHPHTTHTWPVPLVPPSPSRPSNQKCPYHESETAYIKLK